VNYLNLYSSYPDHAATAAWNAQLTDALQTPWLKELLLGSAAELFPRFAACHAELRALPRSARRTLQRKLSNSRELAVNFPEWLQSGVGRSCQTRLTRSLAGAALLMALSQGVAVAATITVTTKDPAVRPDGQCSLTEAIVNANADASVFSDCAAGSGADTIVLPAKANVKLSDVYDSTYGPTGLPLISSSITIQGNGARIRGQGPDAAFRLVAVSDLGELTLENLTLSDGVAFNGGGVFNNGILTIQNSTISGNSAALGGGVANHGALTIDQSAIIKNSAGLGGGVSNGGLVYIGDPISQNPFKTGPFCFYYFYGYGGVFCNYYAYAGSVIVSNSTISKNSASLGAAIFNQMGTSDIRNSSIVSNNGYWGGGVFNSGGSFDYYAAYIPAGRSSIIESVISKNSGNKGGGLFNQGALTIESSTISGNKASEDGGGVFNYGSHNDYYGRYVSGGDLSLVDSTISGNRAKNSGGGLVNYGSLTMSNSVVSGNKARIGADVFP
jgi:hypothetical protein